MKRISSSTTAFSKKGFPALWFGFLAFFLISALSSGGAAKDPMVLLVPILMGAFGFFIMKALVWDLADEVLDCGDYLIVRKGKEEDSIRLANIMNVSMMNSRPPRITLRLIQPCRFGLEVTFTPPTQFSFNPFAKNPVAEELIQRAYAARSEHAV